MNRIVIFFGAIIILLFLVINLISNRPKQTKPNSQPPTLPQPTAPNLNTKNSPQIKIEKQKENKNEQDPARLLEAQLQERSEEIRTQYTELTGLKFAGWENFRFENYDMGDDQIAGLMASNPYQGSKVGALASKVILNPDGALNFIKNHTHELPGFPKTPLNFTPQAISEDFVRQKGLKSANLWVSENESSLFAAVYLTRVDQKGSYLITISGPKNKLSNNEGYFDQLIMGIQIAPVK